MVFMDQIQINCFLKLPTKFTILRLVSLDPEDLEPLPPNHFVLLRPQPHPAPRPAPAEQNRQLSASKRTWRTAQALVD